MSLDSPNRKRAEAQNAPVVPALPENESTVSHANNLEVERLSVRRTKAANGYLCKQLPLRQAYAATCVSMTLIWSMRTDHSDKRFRISSETLTISIGVRLPKKEFDFNLLYMGA